MERASRLLGKIKIPAQTYGVEELARAAWPMAVGKKIAAHSHAARMVRSSLIVEVEDEVWRLQLWALRGQILSNLARQIGEKRVEELQFRVVPMRLGPKQAAAASDHISDDSERISDPGLRRIYRAERSRFEHGNAAKATA